MRITTTEAWAVVSRIAKVERCSIGNSLFNVIVAQRWVSQKHMLKMSLVWPPTKVIDDEPQ